MDLLTDQDFVTTLLEDVQLSTKKVFSFSPGSRRVSRRGFVGDDLATAESVIMSPKTYRDIIKPYHKEYFKNLKSWLLRLGSLSLLWKYFSFIPDLIEVGVDILNPVQVSAQNMDTKVLKEKFGGTLFWGAIDTTRFFLEELKRGKRRGKEKNR